MKKMSSWWAIAAVLLLVGAAVWYEAQYRAASKPAQIAPVRRAETPKPPEPQPTQKPSTTPGGSGLLTG